MSLTAAAPYSLWTTRTAIYKVKKRTHKFQFMKNYDKLRYFYVLCAKELLICFSSGVCRPYLSLPLLLDGGAACVCWSSAIFILLCCTRQGNHSAGRVRRASRHERSTWPSGSFFRQQLLLVLRRRDDDDLLNITASIFRFSWPDDGDKHQ